MDEFSLDLQRLRKLCRQMGVDTMRAHSEAMWDDPWLEQFDKWEHEHFVNMVVNYGLTVETEDGSETLQDPRRNS